MKYLKKYLLVLFGSLLILSGCSLPGLASNHDRNTIAITGGIITEKQIMAHVVAGMIEHYTDKNTTIVDNLGTTTITHKAMVRGDADISSTRYTGTDMSTVLQIDQIMDSEEVIQGVKKEFKDHYNQIRFQPYGIDNVYVFAVRKDTAKKYHLKTISDLEEVQDELKVGADRAWMTSPGDGYPGMQVAYGFSFDHI